VSLNQPRKFWMRWRVRVGYPVAVLYWVLAWPTLRSIAFGIGLALIGLVIRALAAGHLKKDRELAITGPYAATRNPLYLGSAFLAVAFAIAGNSYLAGGLVVIYFAIFYYFVMRNEESDLKERFGSTYELYAERVPLFLPKFWGATYGAQPPVPGAQSQAFSLDQYKKNREYRALLGTIAGFGVVLLRMWIRSRYGY
jgi:protein-S-isoprenylcysteine O-methyltransferase Ste14